MAINYDLKKLEKRTASALFQDGIFDMSLGLVLIAFGVASLLTDILVDPWDSLLGFLIYITIAIPLFLVQYFVTKPRLGVVKFSNQRLKKNKIVMILGVVILVANIVLLVLTFLGIIQFTANEYLLAAFFGLIPLIVFLLMAYFLDFKRLYIVGPLFGVGFTIKEILTIQGYMLIGNIVFISLGAIIISIGIVCFILFLKKYPKVEVPEYEFQENTIEH